MGNNCLTLFKLGISTTNYTGVDLCREVLELDFHSNRGQCG